MSNFFRNHKKPKNTGVYTVEFAIVGSLFFLLFFSVIEVARLMLTWNILTEVSRRGARLAVVCPVVMNSVLDSNVANSASFSEKFLHNLTMDNVEIKYMDFSGSILDLEGSPDANPPVFPQNTPNQIRLVKVSITGYQHQLLIPGLFLTLNSPSFTTVLPRESLGATRWGDSDCS
ncbi:TadE/TadG family type IV pilus assembly protein [Thalassotalea psychrophila]|uniref:TadE/TadG family type IV pilus assembly protein n=1 Tax=Thalassotalea psychrophila TaxID=3065647 RepID=A0ABY9TX29_9GAMM|nr:TadE/TadG family type IV pilus assembly protein [Colwelliaceae bacterium SQ149]